MTLMKVLSVDSDKGELYIPDNRFKNTLLSMTEMVVDMDGDGILTAKDAKAWKMFSRTHEVNPVRETPLPCARDVRKFNAVRTKRPGAHRTSRVRTGMENGLGAPVSGATHLRRPGGEKRAAYSAVSLISAPLRSGEVKRTVISPGSPVVWI